MTFDVDTARRDTPGCTEVIHFNNAGSSLPPRQVVDAVIDHLKLEARIGGYEAADQAQESVDHTYRTVARLINAAPDEIALVENATRAWDMAFYAVPLKPGDRILTARAEYASNYIAFLQRARATGAEIVVVPSDDTGQLSIDALTRLIDARVKLIAVTHVPTNGGLVNPAAEIGRIARAHGIPFLLDACQSIGQLPVDVEAIGCDMLSATGRKFLRGPRGTGFLYVRRTLIEQLEPPFLDLHAATWVAPDRYEVRRDARRFENWETYVAGRIGLGVAADYANRWGLPAIARRVGGLAETLREGLAARRGITVLDLGTERSGIVTFTKATEDPKALQHRLRSQGINVSTSGRQSTLLDMSARDLTLVVRASVHYYNTEDEISRFLSALG